MIIINVGAIDVARIRFAPEAVSETAASLSKLRGPSRLPIRRRLRALLPATPDFDFPLLLALTGTTSWLPDIFVPVPQLDRRPPLEQLASVRDSDPSVAMQDLAVLRRLGTYPAADTWTTEEFLDNVTRALTSYYHVALEPLWEEVDAIVEADIAYRSTILADQGLEAVINTIDPCIQFKGSRLTFDLPGYDEVTSPRGDGLAFVPSVFRRHGLVVNWLNHVPTINYPAIGADLMWAIESRSAIGPGLSGLMGRTRATLLADLEQPQSTTALARRHGLAPATVSRHLSVLSAAGLVTSYRRGRWVLYSRTPLAASLLRGDDNARPSSADTAPPDA